MNTEKIDFVVTWVDGNDPEWAKERDKYISVTQDNSTKENRFRDWDLMRYWFRGVEKFAPWVNKVFFVTCGHYPEWLDLDNPKLRFVRHEDYIPNELLPTFNSNTIEMNLHRIPDLSEKFVLFNDDMFLISKTSSSDFFDSGLPCESALLGVLSARDEKDVFPYILLNNITIINKYFNKRNVLKDNWKKFFNIKYGTDVVRNISLSPFVYFSDFWEQHLAISHLKSVFEEIWRLEPDYMYNATKSKFRSINDVNHWLAKDWYICEGKFFPRRTDFGRKFELGRDNGYCEYITKQSGKIICLNDSNDKIDFEKTKLELHDIFESFLPDKSSFEK